MNEIIYDAEPTFLNSPDGLIVRKDQEITDEFLADIADKRHNSTSMATGWFHEVAEVPTGVVEIWQAQGFDIVKDRNIKARDIVARLRRDGLDAFITTNKRV
jgi:hypothetical protein